VALFLPLVVAAYYFRRRRSGCITQKEGGNEADAIRNTERQEERKGHEKSC
jgi:hypothetical protein